MQIAFWSPVHGQTGTTTNIAAIATYLAITKNIKIMVAHSQVLRSTLEKCFIPSGSFSEDSMLEFADNGIDALSRLERNGRLTSDILSNYTISILKNSRLDLLAGTLKKSSEDFERENEILRSIFEISQEYYDLVLIDLHSGLNSQLTQALLESSDLIVVCLNQNHFVLQDYFVNGKLAPELIKTKKIMYFIGFYDNGSRYTVKNVKKQYAIDRAIGVLPYNVQFRDAINSSRVVEFFIRNINAEKNDNVYYFINKTSESANTILDEAGLRLKG